MLNTEIYGEFETAWCPGCGDHAIMKSLKKALATLELAPHQYVHCSGIGQAAKTPHYLRCNCFNGLHGRSLPPAQAIKLANPEATVLVSSGDGCSYGEGGNHFLAAIRRNVDMTVIVHDNQIYGLTKGQASPTTIEGSKTKSQPWGVTNQPFNPVAVAVTMKANFVARSFSGMMDHLTDMIVAAVRHPGFSLVDVMQPCVSFNKINTFAWYKERCKPIPDSHDPTDWDAAMQLATTFGETIPMGILYKNDRPPLHTRYKALAQGPLCNRTPNLEGLARIMEGFA
ncbi:2-oxoacid:ferredoxin oxidoreductase subunit beta [Megalodesulfovibrio paquesii]